MAKIKKIKIVKENYNIKFFENDLEKAISEMDRLDVEVQFQYDNVEKRCIAMLIGREKQVPIC